MGSSLRLKQCIFVAMFVALCGIFFFQEGFEKKFDFSWPPIQCHHTQSDIAPYNSSVMQSQTLGRCGADFSPWDISTAVNGAPTKLYIDNLRNDTRYITSFATSGFTNEFIGLVNMIYLATLSNRVPIVPPFAPHQHISITAGIVPFSDVFDLPHLRAILRLPILEWLDVKQLPSISDQYVYTPSEIEQIGCWSATAEFFNPDRADLMMRHVGLDVSFTVVPSYVRMEPGDILEHHVLFSSLAALINPFGPSSAPNSFSVNYTSSTGSELSPNDHLSCFDSMYYATSVPFVKFEWEFPWSPAWHVVGKHVRFSKQMLQLVKQYLRKVFQTGEDDFPPFIAVHIRRGDFTGSCGAGRICILQDLSEYAKAVEKVREELRLTRGLDAHHILITSDESDPNYWARVREMGWTYINHTEEQTLEKYGEWYLPMLDTASHSLASGFVGTQISTFSLVSERRVKDWNHGVTRQVTGMIGSTPVST